MSKHHSLLIDFDHVAQRSSAAFDNGIGQTALLRVDVEEISVGLSVSFRLEFDWDDLSFARFENTFEFVEAKGVVELRHARNILDAIGNAKRRLIDQHEIASQRNVHRHSAEIDENVSGVLIDLSAVGLNEKIRKFAHAMQLKFADRLAEGAGRRAHVDQRPLRLKRTGEVLTATDGKQARTWLDDKRIRHVPVDRQFHIARVSQLKRTCLDVLDGTVTEMKFFRLENETRLR